MKKVYILKVMGETESVHENSSGALNSGSYIIESRGHMFNKPVLALLMEFQESGKLSCLDTENRIWSIEVESWTIK